MPDGDYTLAWREFVRSIRAPSQLSANVRVWRVWDGTATSDDPFASGNCPWVRLTPLGITTVRMADAGDAEPGTYLGEESWTVAIETVVTGTDVADSLNLWALLKNAIYPQTEAARAARDAAYYAVGILDVRLDRPAIPQSPADFADGFITAAGQLTLVLGLKQ